MLKPQKPENEAARLAALHRYQILDTDGESAFDDLVAIVAAACAVPMASVSLVDAERQWFKAQRGLGETTETTRDVSFCGHAILDPSVPLIVPDATRDERFRDNPSVTGEPYIRFYAGAPLLSVEGHAVGTLCVMDVEPRELAIAMLDIDHFKNVNDLYGHAEGDRVLVALAAMLKSQFAGRGMAARYGGEEFVLLMLDTGLEEARLQCEYVRQGAALLPLGLPVTVSIGVAGLQRQDEDPEDMFRRADEALYQAKRNGRDRVVVA